MLSKSNEILQFYERKINVEFLQFLIKGAKELLSDLYKRFFAKRDQASGAAAASTTPEPPEEEPVENDCFTLSQHQDSVTGGVSFVEIAEVRQRP